MNKILGAKLYPHQADFIKLYDLHKKGSFLVCKSCRQVRQIFFNHTISFKRVYK